MIDLWRAIAVMGAIAALAAAITARKVSKDRQRQMLVIAISTFGMFAFLFYAAGRLYWALLIPDSAAIIWSNWTPVFAAIAASCCLRLAETPLWRRLLMGIALACTALAALIWPFLNIWLRPPPAGDNLWNGPVAMQSGWATCSPAAAATFFTASGIDVSEAEMVPRCLTDASGTPTLGLYRGAKVTAQQHGRQVAARILSADQLSNRDQFPILIMVKLPEKGVDDPRYEQQWGWVPGLGHSVVILEPRGDDRFLIGDPSVGPELWSRQDLKVLWRGDAIQFIPTSP